MQASIKRIITGFFLVLFVGYYANATLFEHGHVINGVTIVHSHFHSESHHATPSGGHSASNLILIAALNDLHYVSAAEPPCNLTAYPFVYEVTAEADSAIIPVVPIIHHYLRAPPALL